MSATPSMSERQEGTMTSQIISLELISKPNLVKISSEILFSIFTPVSLCVISGLNLIILLFRSC